MPNTIIQKLNFKDQSPILVFQAPDSFQPVITEWKALTKVQTRIGAKTNYPFVLVFVQTEPEVEAMARSIVHALMEDAVFWVAYPKKTSRKYKSSINRDQGWTVLGDLGFEPVRQVAIDEDWSALRFRQADHIRKMTRRTAMALSKTGKAKTKASASR